MPIISTQTLEFKITSVQIDLLLGIIILKVSKGYEDGTNFVKLTEIEVTINQTDSAVLFSVMGDATKTLYTSVKEGLYQYLIDSGTFAGTIS